MAAVDKLLDRMRRNPHADWHIDDFKTIARARGISWRTPGGSHVIFIFPEGAVLSVPARRPIKPVYVRLSTDFVDRSGSKRNES